MEGRSFKPLLLPAEMREFASADLSFSVVAMVWGLGQDDLIGDTFVVLNGGDTLRERKDRSPFSTIISVQC